jgi:VCBS repeat-containing protein
MITAIEYALMAGAAYISNRDPINQFPTPQGWLATRHDNPPDGSGFEAISFINGATIATSTEIVISYAGTDFSQPASDFLHGNIPLVLGIVSDQLKQAADYYLTIKALNPGAHITLTGHSLGGGIAALIGVFFGETAFTFDQAPFAETAKLGAAVLKNYLATELDANGNRKYSDAQLSGLTDYIQQQQAHITLFTPIPNEGLVINLNVQGEIVSLGSKLRLGSDTSIPNVATGVSATNLHSQALLTAFLQSNQTAALGQALNDVTSKLTNLLEMIFDKKLYAFDTAKSNTQHENFLEHIIKDQAAQGANPAQGEVTHFTTDLWKITPDTGLIQPGTLLNKAMIAAAIEDYYFMQSGFTHEFFNSISGGISFDLADIGTDWSTKKASVLLDNALTQELNLNLQSRMFLSQDNYWSIQSGADALNATGTGSNNDAMIGGTSGDTLDGGEGNDFLYGGDGADTLTGGAGNDVLIGGTGNDTLDGGSGYDTYLIEGTDTIRDSDGKGYLKDKAGNLISGAIEKHADGSYTYQNDPNISVSKDANLTLTLADGSVAVIENFKDGDLGLTIVDATAKGSNAIQGDDKTWTLYKTDSTTGDKTYIDTFGNYIIDPKVPRAGVAASNLADILNGSTGNDNIYGGAILTPEQAIWDGNNNAGTGQRGDWLAGNSGNDTLITGAGNDVLSGGGGNDLLIAGAGDDDILGDTNWTPASTDWSVTDEPLYRLFNPAIGTTRPADAGNDTIYAGDGADHVWAGAGNDVVYGEGGNDILSGNDGNDMLFGGAGDDHIYGDSIEVFGQTFVAEGDDYIDGGDGNDVINGEGGNDTLLGGAGDDQLYGGQGANYLDGGDGNDKLYAESNGNTLLGGAGDDQLFVTAGSNNTLDGGDGNDTLSATGGSNYLDGGEGDNTLYAEGGNNELFAGAGTDQLTALGGNNYLDGGEGDNTLVAEGGNNQLVAGAGADQLTARGGNNYLDGGEGNNTVVSYGDNNALYGGTGNDVLSANAGGSNYLDAGDGDNTLYAEGGNNQLFAGAGADRLSATGGGNSLDAGEGNNILVAEGGNNQLFAGAGADQLTARGGNNYLDAGAGNNTLYAEGGHNQMFAGAGSDQFAALGGSSYLEGGDGADNLWADGGSNTELGGAGNDTLQARGGSNTLDGGDGADTLIADNGGNNTLMGGAGDDYLAAIGGDNTLLGGAGNDTLYAFGSTPNTMGGYSPYGGANFLDGGEGSDTYIFDSGFGVTHIADSGTGGNTAQFNFNFTGSGVIFGIGSLKLSFANGDELHIDGFNPDDPLNTCSITTFQFADRTLSLQEVLDIGAPDINGTTGDDIIQGTGLRDRIYAGDGNDTINAGSGNDIIDGGAGSDTMAGGMGDDIYLVDTHTDAVIEGLNAGIDTVQSTATNYTLTDNVENLTLMGTDNIDGTGNALDNVITGNDGDNVLDGGTGADTLIGGLGSDTYFVDNVGDQVIEDQVGPSYSSWQWNYTPYGWQYQLSTYTTPQIDTVNASISYTLGNNVENLNLIGAGNIDGTGNELDNVINGNDGNNTLVGNAGNDVLNGGAGADVMIGGAGNDTYFVDNAGDRVIETIVGQTSTSWQWVWDAQAGWQYQPYSYVNPDIETVNASISYTLGNNIENLNLTGAGNIDGTGNELNNVINGNDGNNTLLGGAGDDALNGGAGIDVMDGGDGNDTYYVDNAADTAIESATGGYDTVIASADYTLSDNVEMLQLSGSAISGTGNAQDNSIYGNDMDNVLNGMAGNDYLDGGTGNDTIYGGTGDDNIYGGGDQWNSSLSNDDTLYGGEGNDYVDGGSGNDIIDGGAGNDTLYGGQDDGYNNESNYSNLGNNDTIYGGDGNDFIDGQSGADRLFGGTGDDAIYGGNNTWSSRVWDTSTNTYIRMSNDDYIDGGDGNDTLYGQEGNDTLLGGAGDDVVDGGNGNDLLDGGTGINTLIGGAGDDTYIVDGTYTKVAGTVLDDCGDLVPVERLQWTNTNTIIENAGKGYDVVMSNGSFALSDNVEELRLIFDSNTAAIDPQRYADLLAFGQDGTGNGLDNVIIGNELSNRIDGGLGADTMDGGAGNDTYVVDNAGDTIIEQANGGIDTVESSISYSLDGTNLENLTLLNASTGQVANLDGTGSSADNLLIGNADSNTLAGLDGNDTLIGGAGNDTLLGGAGNDRYVVRLGDGADTIIDSQGTDTLFIGNDLTAADLQANRIGDDLILNIINTNDSITLTNWFAQSEGVSRIEFCNSPALDHTGIKNLWNAPPVAHADTIVTNEDVSQTLITAAALLANDTDPNIGDVLALSGFDGVTANGNTVIQDANGNLVLDIGNRYQSLAAGQVATDSFSYTIADTMGATSTATVNVTITGSNDAPVVATAVADQATLQDAAFSFIIPAGSFTDIDQGDVLIYAATMADGTALPSWLTFDAVTQTFSGVPSNWDVGNLNVSVTATDTGGLTASSTFAMNVINVNDPPVANADVGAATEDGGIVVLNAATLLANDTDPDFIHGDAIHIVGITQANSGATVSLVNGNIQYDIGNLYQSLAQGQTATDTFTYTIADTAGLTSTATVTMTVTGVNDAPVTVNDTVAVQEDLNIQATGNVLSNDSDVDQGTVLSVANAGTLQGAYGSLILNADGSYQYALNNAALNVQSLAQGQVVTETFTYQATDGIAFTPATLTVTVTGTNDAPVTTADAAAVQEDATVVATGNVLTNDKDVDQGTVLQVANAGVFTGQFGTLTLNADGSYNYELNNAASNVQSLAQGQVVTDTFAYQATDGIVATPSTLTVSITGTNDAPVTTVDTAVVQEDLTIVATGNVLTNDKDVDQGAVLQVANAGVFTGQFGTLTLNADGSYNYALNNAASNVQSLAQGQVVTDTFAYQATDGIVATPSTLTVSITGTNDAPVVAIPLIDQSVKQSTSFNLVLPTHAFTDVDRGDKLSYTATLADGSALPSWVTFNAATQTFSGTSGDPTRLHVKVTATDLVGATASSAFTLDIAQVATCGKTLTGSCDGDKLTGTIGDDILDGGSGADTMTGGMGNDTYLVDNASDKVAELASQGVDTIKSSVTYTLSANVENLVLTGSAAINGTDNAQNNWLTGNSANNILTAGLGNDVLNGDAGNDTLIDTAGNNVFMGGAGTDKMTGNSGNELFIGGTGNDTITTGTGADVIAFNKGDGQDIINASIGKDNTLSLGGGIKYTDLALSKVNNDLVLEVGNGDQINLKNWYATNANYKSVLDLQVVAEAMTGFNRTSTDPLLNQAVQNFDFSMIVNAFDQANGGSSSYMHWSATNSLLAAHLTGSDTTALGGDLAYQYGKGNTMLAGVGPVSTQNVLAAPQFGTQAQTLQPLQQLQGLAA